MNKKIEKRLDDKKLKNVAAAGIYEGLINGWRRESLDYLHNTYIDFIKMCEGEGKGIRRPKFSTDEQKIASALNWAKNMARNRGMSCCFTDEQIISGKM